MSDESRTTFFYLFIFSSFIFTFSKFYPHIIHWNFFLPTEFLSQLHFFLQTFRRVARTYSRFYLSVHSERIHGNQWLSPWKLSNNIASFSPTDSTVIKKEAAPSFIGGLYSMQLGGRKPTLQSSMAITQTPKLDVRFKTRA